MQDKAKDPVPAVMLLSAVPNWSFTLDFTYSISNELIVYAKWIMKLLAVCLKATEELYRRLLSAPGPGWFDIKLILI